MYAQLPWISDTTVWLSKQNMAVVGIHIWRRISFSQRYSYLTESGLDIKMLQVDPNIAYIYICVCVCVCVYVFEC